MTEPIIRVENLGKKYRIRHHQAGKQYVALRDVIADKVKGLFKRRESEDRRHKTAEDFWALQDVSFDVKQGEVVGIIGRNGAGKSTLLKVLSRITEPTSGRVTLNGRVASLLEVGTGFHPELTGRENIFLNGSILGMTRVEIQKRFDEIVEFAEIEKFLDTPVKRYSSGMYMRLAFAVAAHMEPEILIVDEVLAVGDAEFQKKCLGKMGAVARGGRTVLFVSHNMGAINDLCSRCLLLSQGRAVADGSTDEITRKYLAQGEIETGEMVFDAGRGVAYFESVAICDETGKSGTVFDVRKPIGVKMRFTLKQSIPGLQVALALINDRGERIFYHCNAYAEPVLSVEAAGTHVVTAQIPGNLLVPGGYHINVALHEPHRELYDLREHILPFRVEDTGSRRYEFSDASMGCVLVNVKWSKCSDIV